MTLHCVASVVAVDSRSVRSGDRYTKQKKDGPGRRGWGVVGEEKKRAKHERNNTNSFAVKYELSKNTTDVVVVDGGGRYKVEFQLKTVGHAPCIDLGSNTFIIIQHTVLPVLFCCCERMKNF